MADILSDLADYTEQLLRREFDGSDLTDPHKVQVLHNVLHARLAQVLATQRRNRGQRGEILREEIAMIWRAFQPHLDRMVAQARKRGMSAIKLSGDLAAHDLALTSPVVQESLNNRNENASSDNPSIALLRVYTNGISDDRIKKASEVLVDGKLTTNEKLTKIDKLIPIPPTASAQQLGKLLGVTKQAVLKTDWWIQNRKGETQNEVGRRRTGHQKRSEEYERPDPRDDE